MQYCKELVCSRALRLQFKQITLLIMVTVESGSSEDKANWKAPKKETQSAVEAANAEVMRSEAEGRAFQQMESDMMDENDGKPLSLLKSAEFSAVWSGTNEAMRKADDARDNASLLKGLESGGKMMESHEIVKAAGLAIDAGDATLLLNAEKSITSLVPLRVEERLRDEFKSNERVSTLADVIRIGKENPSFAEEARVAQALIDAKKPQS